jgi:alkylation response protein AidB-like acyl-CoA dehydrogenase
MADYQPPVPQMRFTIEHLAEFKDVAALPAYAAVVDSDTAAAVLEEAARFASEVLAPINQLGDREGVRVVNKGVQVPEAFKAAYRQFCEGGWPGVALNPEFGGQGLPKTISIACDEMWAAANVSFALCPELSQGAIMSIDRHGTDQLKQQYLAKLISGEWTGAMCLTESQAGSDLSSLTTRAEPQGDGAYKVTGTKIFITWGDHDMTDNVVHLVLARIPGAPQGTKGISLFLVPKFMLNADGTPGARNDLFCGSVEHKLGIHASPTCVMTFGERGGATGYLVGHENEGLAAMFTMMNYMRLGVGAQGVGLADRAYQAGARYARERVQGRAPGERGRVPIIRHPDVRRTLLLMRVLTQACRSICYYTASCLDRGNYDDSEASATWRARGDLMTPIAKAFSSEIGQEVTSLGLQLHGGMGYVEETGVAQFYRDVRIAAIYEGTNAIQAIDLVGRKLLRDGGATVSAFVSDMRAIDAPLANADEELSNVRLWLAKGLDELVQCSTQLLSGERKDPELPNAAAFNYLMLAGTVIGGWQLARGALVAAQQLEAGTTDAAFYRLQVLMARFYAEHVMPRTVGYASAIRAGSKLIMELPAEQF